MGSQQDAELTLQPSVVEAEELVASGGASLWCVQLQLLKRLGDRVEAGGVERLTAVGACANPPSIVTMKSRFPKCTCAPGTQLTL